MVRKERHPEQHEVLVEDLVVECLEDHRVLLRRRGLPVLLRDQIRHPAFHSKLRHPIHSRVDENGDGHGEESTDDGADQDLIGLHHWLGHHLPDEERREHYQHVHHHHYRVRHHLVPRSPCRPREPLAIVELVVDDLTVVILNLFRHGVVFELLRLLLLVFELECVPLVLAGILEGLPERREERGPHAYEEAVDRDERVLKRLVLFIRVNLC
mmetsp:Transcript_12328/g.25358  ORF Transcript_12328/g.25358 Transcript_12328/m.25358 type:complete len:212 (-) Transcript_12328:211-846(-)